MTIASTQNLEEARVEAQKLVERMGSRVSIREEIEARQFQPKPGDQFGDGWRLYVPPQDASLFRRICVTLSWIVGFPLVFLYSIGFPLNGLLIAAAALVALWATRCRRRVRVDDHTGLITEANGTRWARFRVVGELGSVTEIAADGCRLLIRMQDSVIRLQEYEDEEMTRLAAEDLRKVVNAQLSEYGAALVENE